MKPTRPTENRDGRFFGPALDTEVRGSRAAHLLGVVAEVPFASLSFIPLAILMALAMIVKV